MNKTGLIYKHTCVITNKCYIGKTINTMEKRLKGHLSSVNNGEDSKFYRAIRKYGIDSFNSEVIVENVPEYFLNSFEKYWINFYDSCNHGYNSTYGGDGVSNMPLDMKIKMSNTKNNKSLELKNEYSKKISNSMKEIWKDPVYREQQSKSHSGKPNSEEQKKKISKSLTGRRKPEGFRLGIKFSQKTKEKISMQKRGIKNPRFTPKTIYKSDGSPYITILVKFREECSKLGLPTSLGDTYKNNNTLYEGEMRKCDITKLTNEGKYQYKGWFCRLAKL